MQLARPSNIARVELQLAERSMMDYAPHLEIESTDEGGRTRRLYRASPYPELAAAILRNGRYSALQLDVPANETVTLRVRQTSATRRSWSIHELRLWRR